MFYGEQNHLSQYGGAVQKKNLWAHLPLVCFQNLFISSAAPVASASSPCYPLTFTFKVDRKKEEKEKKRENERETLMKGITKWTASSSGGWGYSTRAWMWVSLSLSLPFVTTGWQFSGEDEACRWLPDSSGVRICMKSLLDFFDHFLPHISNEAGPNLWVRACVCDCVHERSQCVFEYSPMYCVHVSIVILFIWRDPSTFASVHEYRSSKDLCL